jgi:hypothetical protein
MSLRHPTFDLMDQAHDDDLLTSGRLEMTMGGDLFGSSLIWTADLWFEQVLGIPGTCVKHKSN